MPPITSGQNAPPAAAHLEPKSPSSSAASAKRPPANPYLRPKTPSMAALPLYILLDNEVFLSLTPSDDINDQLDLLLHHARTNSIRLLLPDALNTEWQRHRSRILEEIGKLSKNSKKATRIQSTFAPIGTAVTENQFMLLQSNLSQRIDLMDQLLTKYATAIPLDPEMLTTLHSFRRDAKAPFHKRDEKDHFNDAEIIYSSIDYCRTNTIPQLIFVSNNTGEFATLKGADTLHPDYNDYCPALSIRYFTELSDAIKLFPDAGLAISIPQLLLKNNQPAPEIAVDRSLSIIRQAHAYLKAKLAICLRWPKHLLADGYPFIINPEFDAYYAPFALVTDNQQLYEILTNVQIGDDQIVYLKDFPTLPAEDEAPLREVVQILFDHLFFRIAFNVKRAVGIQYASRFAANPKSFIFHNTLAVGPLLDHLSSVETGDAADPQSVIEKAYYYYKTQQHMAAATLLLQLRAVADQLTPMQRYIVDFNLHLLHTLLHRYLSTTPGIARLLDECARIDLDTTRQITSTPETRQLIDYIHEHKFHQETIVSLNNSRDDIRRLYIQQSTGGSPATESLIDRYFSCAEFLAGNYIIFDQFQQFEAIARPFTEGLITSAFCNPFHSAKLPALDDTFAYELILHGKGDDLRRWARHENFQNIPYEPNGDRPPIFESLVALFEDYEDLYQRSPTLFADEAPFLFLDIEAVLNNGLVVCALCRLPQDAASRIITGLLNFLEHQTNSQLFNIHDGIAFFIWNQRRHISDDQFHALFSLLLRQSILRREPLVSTFAYTLRKLPLALDPTPEESLDLQRLLTHPDNQPAPEWENFCDLHELLVPGVKKQELTRFARQLIESNFNPQHYYLACLSDIILPDETNTRRYLGEVEKLLAAGRGAYIRQRTFYTNNVINQCLNFCWKFDLPIPGFLLEKAADFDPYYEWLTDIDRFDYSRFDKEWLKYYFTKYYKKRYRQSTVLKKQLIARMKEVRSPDLERFLAVTYSIDEYDDD
jgi:hypothetical protein